MYDFQNDNASAHDLDRLKRVINIRDLGQTTMKQFAQIQKMAAEGDLSLQEVGLLIAAIPHALELQKETLEGLRHIAAQATANQKGALDRAVGPVLASLEALKSIAATAETDQARIELARMVVEVGTQGVEVSRIVAEINRNNNGFWTSAAGAAAAVAVALLFVFSGGRIRIPVS